MSRRSAALLVLGVGLMLVVTGLILLAYGYVSAVQDAQHQPELGAGTNCVATGQQCDEVEQYEQFRSSHHEKFVAGELMAVAGGLSIRAAAVVLRRARRDVARATVPADGTADGRALPGASLAARLAELSEAHTQGLLTDEEHDRQRQRLLTEL